MFVCRGIPFSVARVRLFVCRVLYIAVYCLPCLFICSSVTVVRSSGHRDSRLLTVSLVVLFTVGFIKTLVCLGLNRL